MPLSVFTSKRGRASRDAQAAGVGELRLTAKATTGAGIVEPVLGMLYCNGAAVSRATYKRLFDLIGTTFGVGLGDGLTFSLPDFRGRFIAGWTDGSAAASKITALALGGVLGAESVALGKVHLPPHTHDAGTFAVASGGAHQHGSSALFPPSVNTAQSNDFAWTTGNGSDQAGVSQPKLLDGGTATATTHSHAPDAGTATGNGSADGLVATAHQNVHPHQAIGGVLVAY